MLRTGLFHRLIIRKDRNLTAGQKDEPVWVFPFKRWKSEDLTAEQALYNRLLASWRAVVKHPFRIIKRQFGYTKGP